MLLCGQAGTEVLRFELGTAPTVWTTPLNFTGSKFYLWESHLFCKISVRSPLCKQFLQNYCQLAKVIEIKL